MTTPASCTASTAPHFVRLSNAALRAAWRDKSRTVISIAAEFGLSTRAIRVRAKALGEPVRSHNTKRPSITPAMEPLFKEAYAAGVKSADLAGHFKISERTVANTVERLRLPKRGQGRRSGIGMADFLQSRAVASLARTAAAEQAAMIQAEMADARSGGGLMTLRYVGGRHVAKAAQDIRP